MPAANMRRATAPRWEPARSTSAREAVVAIATFSSAAPALSALAGPRHSLADAIAHVPHRPGLYAIYGSADVWAELSLSDPDDRPLYVGKSESSLADRDLRTHFGDGRTGSSTVRRSFAALLHDALGLHGMPRNPAKPERFANYGLSLHDDAALTGWMRTSLTIAIWPGPLGIELLTIERALLGHWLPPLNLRDVSTLWTGQVKAARAAMAAEARWYAERRQR